MRTKNRLSAWIVVCGLLLPTLGALNLAAQPAPASSASPLDVAFTELAAVRRIPEVALSPDGRSVAWLEGDSAQRPSRSPPWGTHRKGATHRPGPGHGDGPPHRLVAGRRPSRFLVGHGRTRAVPSLYRRRAGRVRAPTHGAQGRARQAALLARRSHDRVSLYENARAAAGPVAAKPTETGVIGERDGRAAPRLDRRRFRRRAQPLARRLSTSTSSTGLPTASASSRPPPRLRATTVGTSPSSTRSI